MRCLFALPAILFVSLSPVKAQFPVLTYHNDNARTGQNLKETVLTPSLVSGGSFGLQFSYAVDGQVYAQPLYMPQVSISGAGVHNVIFIATENDSVYAFDADSDNGANASPLWQAALANPAAGVTPVPSGDLNCTAISPQVGITGTPVIDAANGTLYVVAKTKEVTAGSVNYYQRLHALDVTSGAEKFGGPFIIAASVPGTCIPNVNGRVVFSALHQNQRAGLVLSNGTLYIAWASHCDNNPYTGWLMAFHPSTGKLLRVFNAAPDMGPDSAECRAGIWQAGAAPAADSSGNLFLGTGNGYFNAGSGGLDYGDSLLKLTLSKTSLGVADYFTPYNQTNLDALDADVGAGGVLLLPDQPGPNPHLLVHAGKQGSIYLVNRDNMGQYLSGGDTQIVQELPNAIGGVWGMPAYFNGTVFFGGEYDSIKAFNLSNGLLAPTPTSQSSTVYTFPGPTVSVSAHGATHGIVWALDNGAASSGGAAVLHAYDATNLAQELYNSNQNPARDQLGPAVNFTVPTVANGKVFVGTGNSVSAFGPLPDSPNFTLAASPVTLTVAAASANSYAVAVQAVPGYGFNRSVNLAISNLPAGVSAAFTPASVHGPNSSSLMITVSDAVPSGAYPLTITGVSRGVTQTLTVTLVVRDPVAILLPSGSLTVPNSPAGVSFTYNGTLSQEDTIALTQTGNPCLQTGAQYCTNGAGIVTQAGALQVGETAAFRGAYGTTPGIWNFGSLVMAISGVSPSGAAQLFVANAQNGLGSSTPPLSLTLAPISLSALGFSNFTLTNPTVTFFIADDIYVGNSGQFVLSQSGGARSHP